MKIFSESHFVLSRRINELFHDFEGESYELKHPEIFNFEIERWQKQCKKYIHRAESAKAITALDMGSGTGFVGLQLQHWLQEQDTIICADISQAMLKVCQEKLRSHLRCHIQTLKINDERLPLADSSVDLITLNSVLHHIPDFRRVLSEFNRILRPGGTLFIGHEPNLLFSRSFWWRTHTDLVQILHPKRCIAALLKATGVYNFLFPHKPSAIYEKINEVLISEKRIQKPLSAIEISRFIDIHSPTASGWRPDVGFDPWQLLSEFPALRIVNISTYNHLGKNSQRPLWKYYNAILARFFPRRGNHFFLVAERR